MMHVLLPLSHSISAYFFPLLYQIFFQNNFEVSIDLFGHVAVNAQRFNVKSFLQDRKKKHWYILTLPRLNNSTVSHSNFVLDSALEKALKKWQSASQRDWFVYLSHVHYLIPELLFSQWTNKATTQSKNKQASASLKLFTLLLLVFNVY